MKNVELKKLARKYAEALFSRAKDKAVEPSQYLSALEALAKAVTQVSSNKSHWSPSESKDFASTISQQLSQQPDLQDLMKLLGEMNRVYILPQLFVEYRNFCDAHYGIARGELVTSHHVTAQYIESLQNLVSKKIGKQVVFEHRVDPQVLGGARVKVNGWLFDDTLGAHLQKIKSLMTN